MILFLHDYEVIDHLNVHLPNELINMNNEYAHHMLLPTKFINTALICWCHSMTSGTKYLLVQSPMRYFLYLPLE